MSSRRRRRDVGKAPGCLCRQQQGRENLFVSSRRGGVAVLVDSSRTHNQQDARSRRRERGGGGVLLTAVGGREGPLWETHILKAPQEECFFFYKL